MLVMLKVKFTGVQVGVGGGSGGRYLNEMNLYGDDWKTNSIWYWGRGARCGTFILRLT